MNNNPQLIQESLLKSLHDQLEEFAQMIQESAGKNGYISLTELRKIIEELNITLQPEELDYILLTMYKVNRDLNKMKCKVFVDHLQELLEKFSEQFEDYTPDQNITEEQAIGIVQSCICEIAEQIAIKKIPLDSIFKQGIYKKVIDGQQLDLISPENFFKAVERLGVRQFQPIEKGLMSQMLGASETEEGIQVFGFIQTLNDYIMNGGPPDMNGEEFNWENLNKVTMVIFLSLANYIEKKKANIESIFSEVIYKEQINDDGNIVEVELIDSNNFFEIMAHIGIETREEDQAIMEDLLCLSPNDPDKLLVERLKLLLNDLMTNENVREIADEYYQELKNNKEIDVDPK